MVANGRLRAKDGVHGNLRGSPGRIVADPWICLRPVGSAAARRLPIFVDNAREMDDAFGHRPLYDKPTFGQVGGCQSVLQCRGRPILEAGQHSGCAVTGPQSPFRHSREVE